MRRLVPWIVLLVMVTAGHAHARGERIVLDSPDHGTVIGRTCRVRGRVILLPDWRRIESVADYNVTINGFHARTRDGAFDTEIQAEGEEGPFVVRAKLLRIAEDGKATLVAETNVNAILDTTPPDLQLEQPGDLVTRARAGRFLISGTVRDTHLLAFRICGNKVRVDRDGRFATHVPLPPESKVRVRIQAVDEAHNETVRVLLLIAQGEGPRPPPLELPPPDGKAPASHPERVGAVPLTPPEARALAASRRIESVLLRTARATSRRHVSLECVTLRVESKVIRGCTGSGVLLDTDTRRWILTAHHVIDEAKEIRASIGCDRPLPAKVKDGLSRFDVALLEPASDAPFFPDAMPHSPIDAAHACEPRVGMWVLATGNPFGLCTDGRAAVMRGIISSTHRKIHRTQAFSTALQHDARLNPGCSGGALWLLDGSLAGINVQMGTRRRFKGARFTNAGVSLTIPIGQILPFLGAMAGGEEAHSGTLGLTTVTAIDERGRSLGARITAIAPTGPLGQAMQKRAPHVGDVVMHLTVRGKKERITSSQVLEQKLAVLPPGERVKLHYKRGRAYLTWPATLKAAP